MIVREYTEADFETFKRIHAESGLDYQFPDLSSPLFIVRTVVERAGKPTTLVAARIEAETYLLSDGAPADKWADIQAVQPIFLNALWEKGIDNTYCVVPPAVDFHFGKRMKSLGWEQIRDWRPYYRDTVL